MNKILDLIESKDLDSAKTAIIEQAEEIKKTKLLEMKKMVAAKMFSEGTGSKALDAALARIDKTFGPGGTHTTAAIRERTAKARANNPEFNAFLKKVGKKNPYKKD